MIEHHYTDTRVPGSRRLATFDACQLNEPLATHVSSTHADDFRTSLRVVDLTSMDVVAMEASSCRVDHTPALVTESAPELCAVVLPIAGSLGLCQDGREVQLGPDQLALYTSSAPFRMELNAGRSTSSMMRLQLPKAKLAIPDHAVDELTAVPITSQYGFGGLLKDFLSRLIADSSEFGAADRFRLSDLAIGLISALLAQQGDQQSRRDWSYTSSVVRTALLQRIDDHVHDHLSDLELSPHSIATDHHISIGHLHRLFADRDETVAARIRRLRLERARHDLLDPSRDTLPIHRIATRWGFAEHSTFTRAFRAHYGITPRELRSERATIDGTSST